MTPLVGVLGVEDYHFEDSIAALEPLGYEVLAVRSPDELEDLRREPPLMARLFVPHWRHLIPARLLNDWEFVGFHTGRLPEDRGGSPIQHQILKQQYDTELCAFRITSEVDGGPIFLREPFDISEGTIDAILRRASRLAARMMARILLEEPEAVPQPPGGQVLRRRKPKDSQMSGLYSRRSVHDFIRMLDGPGYPSAFLEAEGLRIEFTSSTEDPESDVVTAVARITVVGDA